jgi:hypothetical protein
MPRRDNEEMQPEVTGNDGKASQMNMGSAGNGAALTAADLPDGLEELEEVPQGEDIDTDQVNRFDGAPDEAAEEDSEEVTARPSERPTFELPEWAPGV